MFSVRNMLPLLLVAFLCSLSFGATLTVKQGGGAGYTDIQSAINVAGPNDIIEVQDSATYGGNLLFKRDVNNITLQAKTGFTPIIQLGGAVRDQNYIDIRSKGTTIDGFRIVFTGLPWASGVLDSNSTMIHALGGASTVRNCTIVGPGQADYRIRGISGVANIENVDVSLCRIGVLCDIAQANSGFAYSVSGSRFHNNFVRGILFNDANAVMDDCRVDLNGSTDPIWGLDSGGNVHTQTRGAIADPANGGTSGVGRLLITNSLICDSIRGRNITLEDNGTVTIEDSIIRNGFSDEILHRTGILNLNRCILRAGDGIDIGRGLSCVNLTPDSARHGAICNVDHCTFIDNPFSTQWTLYTLGADMVINIKNSIITGPAGASLNAYGLYQGGGGTINTSYNDIYCSARYAVEGPTQGPHDLNVNPLFIQTTNDANTLTFYALQPYSQAANADEFGSHLGAVAPVSGFEKWPADFTGAHGVDFADFATFASHWRDDNHYAGVGADPNHLEENFEAYSSTGNSSMVGTLLGPRTAGGQSAWRTLTWTYTSGVVGNPTWSAYGTSTITLETPGGNDANSGLGGTKIMRWVYDVNVTPDTNQVQYTEVFTVLPATVNLNKYRTLRVMLKRHSGNSPATETFMYARFLDLSAGLYATPERADVVRNVIGGSTSEHADEWYAWTIQIGIPDPVPAGLWRQGYTTTNWGRIGGIIFGVQTQEKESLDQPYGRGHGVIDMDTIQLGQPACISPPVGDFNLDCVVDFADVDEFVYYWLMGK